MLCQRSNRYWTAIYTGGASGTASGTGSINEIVNMPKGGVVTYTYIINVPSSKTGNFINTANVSVPTGFTDPTPANNTASDSDTPNPVADLSITNTDGKTTYTAGTTNTYTVVATNNGPTDVTGARVIYALPTGVTGTWTAVFSTGSTGTANGTGAISEPVNLPSGSTVTYTITASIAGNVTANPLTTTATITAPAGTTDPTPANNTATDTDTPNPTADLSITNTDGKATYTAGTTNTYTVVASNSGTSDVTGAQVTYPFPTGVTGTWTALFSTGATGTSAQGRSTSW